MEVVVRLQQWRAGGDLHRGEKWVGQYFARGIPAIWFRRYLLRWYRFARTVFEKMVEDADVPGEGQRFEIGDQVDQEEGCAPG